MLSGGGRTALNGIGRGRGSLSSGRRSRTRGTTPCARALILSLSKDFATLECELLDRRRLRSQAEARLAVFSFIEGWHNSRQRHSGLGYLSPIDYERRALAAE